MCKVFKLKRLIEDQESHKSVFPSNTSIEEIEKQ